MIAWALQIFIYMTIADALMSYFPDLRRNPMLEQFHRFMEMIQKPIRDRLPKDLPFDPTPMIVIFICTMLKSIF
jgi:YggT family protein